MEIALFPLQAAGFAAAGSDVEKTGLEPFALLAEQSPGSFHLPLLTDCQQDAKRDGEKNQHHNPRSDPLAETEL